MNKTDARHVVEALSEIFCRLGCPRRMIADNGPPFASKKFEEFCREFGVTLKHLIPYQPRVNEEVEVQNKDLVKAITISHNTGGN